MGVVYEAEQEQPRRAVAVKLIKAGLTTTETLRRFQQESEALGRLQHPGIAQIYEASTADTGFGPQPTSPWSSFAAARCTSTRKRIDSMIVSGWR